ncbi:MAG TPA: hypothetical protein VIH66_04335, partial [Gammaproteobacteria bacterium]
MLSIIFFILLFSFPVSATVFQTSDNGGADTPNVGGFNAGTITEGAYITGSGAGASITVPSRFNRGTGDGHDAIDTSPWPQMKDNYQGDGADAIDTSIWPLLKDNYLGDGHNAIDTSPWPQMKDNYLGDGSDGALGIPA